MISQGIPVSIGSQDAGMSWGKNVGGDLCDPLGKGSERGGKLLEVSCYRVQGETEGWGTYCISGELGNLDF